MKKLCIYLAAALCLTLTACGSDKADAPESVDSYGEYEEYYDDTTTTYCETTTTTEYIPETEAEPEYIDVETEAADDDSDEAEEVTRPQLVIDPVYDVKDFISGLDSSNVINMKVECQNGLSDGDVQVVYLWADPVIDENKYSDDFWGELAAEQDKFKASSARFYINNSDKPVVIDACPFGSEDGPYFITVLAPGQILSDQKHNDDIREETLEKYRSSGVYYAYELNDDIYKNQINKSSYNQEYNPAELSDYLDYISTRQKMKYEFTDTDIYSAKLLFTGLDEWYEAAERLKADPVNSNSSTYDPYNNCNIFYFGEGKLVEMDGTCISLERVSDAEYLDDDLLGLDKRTEKFLVIPRSGTSVTP